MATDPKAAGRDVYTRYKRSITQLGGAVRFRFIKHQYIFLSAGLYIVVFTSMAFFATNSIDRMMLFGSAIWLAPLLALLALRRSAGFVYHLFAYAVALYPTTYAFRVFLTPVDQRDISTFHLVVLFAGLYALVAFGVVLAIAGIDWLGARLRKRLSRVIE